MKKRYAIWTLLLILLIGLMVEAVPAMLSYRIVFVQRNGNQFCLMYWPLDNPEAQSDLNDLMQTTLGSFAFTK